MERPAEPLLRCFAANDALHRPPSPPPRKIPESALFALRGILVSSLQTSGGNGHRVDAPVPRARHAPGRTSSSSPPPPPRRRPRLHVTFDSPTARATAGVTTVNSDNRPSTAPTPPQNSSRGKENAVKDREERLRLVREKHDEERQRKLDELKQQALAVQRYREQKEEERRRRLDEMRSRDSERRQQVEERKRQLFEAEREKRDAILKKNLEREARIVSKRRNERSSIVFAFGSSTPRMLEPSETGGSYWASRRATSTSNVMMLSSTTPMGPLTRRSSERELNECSGKKRAASAGGLSNRSTDDFSEYNNKRHSVMDVLRWSDMCYPVIPEYPVDVGCEGGDGSAERRAARRKTDLMPTIVSPRDLTPCSRPGSSSSSRRSPGRASSMTRLDGTAATAFGGGGVRLLSSARSMSHLAGGGGRSVVLGANKDRSTHHRSMIALNPVPPPRPTRAERLRKRAREFANGGGAGMKSGEMTPNRPQSSMSQSSTGPLPTQPRSRPVATPRKPRPISIAVTGVTSDPPAKSPATGERPPLPKVNVTKKSITPKVETKKFPNDNTKQQSSTAVKDKNKNAKNSTETSDNVESSDQQHTTAVVSKDEDSHRENSIQGSVNDLAECDMTASMLATKQKISTEEEAKAALAERRKLAREQAERDAELERQRLEAERLAEEERLRCEEEEQRRQEEEQLRMLEEARKSEELRLQLAIEETKKREEEDKKRKEEEHKLKLEKEEADRKAKEEAEKLRQEMEIKLKKEEEDRQLRRKRVEAIMLRTRNQGKGNASTKEETESAEQHAGENKTEKPSSDPMTTSQGPVSETDAMLNAERVHSSSSTTSSASSSPTSPTGDTQSNGLLPVETSGSKQNGRADNSAVHQSNGCLPTANGGTVFSSEVQLNNVTNNLLDLSLEPIPSDALSTQQIIDIGMSKCIQGNTADFPAYQETNRSEQQIVNDLLS
ncbi:MAP7 domain-containing protein 2 isoform X5 [Metopolophium dirhodum]|uniref:MAP7 domain-containing protein 2 isoform X5 n=1 Tax=Metopolophium dirhodum TaxID=44670 RepID=UPI00298F9751|nr:MAP7 domain-containing protein 2 isoform X5 [Metopolophium dirhodum]